MKKKDQEILKKFGLQLQRLRKEKNISQRELSYLSGIDHGKISRLENGKANLAVTTLMELAEALEIRPGKLLDFVQN